jgi:hypothetical protein
VMMSWEESKRVRALHARLNRPRQSAASFLSLRSRSLVSASRASAALATACLPEMFPGIHLGRSEWAARYGGLAVFLETRGTNIRLSIWCASRHQSKSNVNLSVATTALGQSTWSAPRWRQRSENTHRSLPAVGCICAT